MGVPEPWIDRVELEDPERHQLFMVRKVDADENTKSGFLEGDIILTLNDHLITRVSNMDLMYTHKSLTALIIRKQQQLSLEIPTIPTLALETHQILVFCGAVIHRPHHAVRQQISKIHSDIYVSARFRGSPAYAYGLAPTNFILAVNAVPVQNLSDLLREVHKIPDNTYFRLKVMTFDNVPWVATMKKNEHYFPTMEFVKDDGEKEGWKRIMYEKDGTKKVGQGEILPEVLEEGVTGAGEEMHSVE
jgi:hypothetical protein